MPCIKFCREVVSDIDVAFTENGLFVQHFDEAENPSTVLSWLMLETEIMEMANQIGRRDREWEKEMNIAKGLIRLGLKLRKTLHEVDPLAEFPHDLPERLPFDPPSSFIANDDDDADQSDRGDAWEKS